ncbi:hypothetical protein MesoLj113b_69940 (plasmid) [Mesorhizobium sp. 113-3-3]|uniref:hypothetical protein n=1 Tax=Mesorhizobium sp. 113-3-3 TaxID=2744516 RepID=UPI0018EACAED|nr:hypothetical protein [Mesorhizobium sp. 113-3-3]BCG83452.1 hypothetical protein MesoLj113b_69940 [Mesorhizobium sp. 113-3-3]
MRQQPKPFIVEKKTSRKLKTDNEKASIWGTLHRRLKQDLAAQQDVPEQPVPAVDITGQHS